jgi:hypothetical protein
MDIGSLRVPWSLAISYISLQFRSCPDPARQLYRTPIASTLIDLGRVDECPLSLF